ncbi:MAG TPA: PepSY domain-containing protein [Gammaproteobacteria bacterium]|nr:PepSY domain-containing protein [Gammaproteobacteria bacterium]
MNADRLGSNITAVSRARRGLLAGAAVALGIWLSGSLPVTANAQELRQPVVSLQEAVEIATRRRPGRVVRAVTVDAGGGRRIHEVRILSDEGGRVVTVRVDAQTGRLC